MVKKFHLTKDGIAELEQEREELRAKRIETAEAIKTAREMGDLSENAEYQSARQDQERIEGRLDEIEHILANSELITAGKSQKIGLGSTVTLKDDKGKEMVVQVVGTIEADPIAQKISDESPIGQALLGKKEGDCVEISRPSGATSYVVHAIR
ncbi:MAG: transcription elongation factor GreA [Candidatus Saccharimonadales bacterium]